MLVEKMSLTSIAQALQRSKSTISRELQRNRGAKGWRPLQANTLAAERQTHNRNARRIAQEDWDRIVGYLQRDLSPEQALFRLSLELVAPVQVSIETIYRHIYAGRNAADKLKQHLRGQKVYRKRYGSGHQRRGSIKNRVSIEQRPAIVDQKTRLGDWEGDTVIGCQQQGVIVTLVERFSRFTLARNVGSKHAVGVAQAINDLLDSHQHKCHTITFDNGKEFALHARITEHLKTDVFFAHPYHSWERGLNENTNGLLRQYFPKKTNFHHVSEASLQKAIDNLNHRPRKCLGYRTPHEVFYGLGIRPLNLPSRCTS